jgi:RHS repeat-associated protein
MRQGGSTLNYLLTDHGYPADSLVRPPSRSTAAARPRWANCASLFPRGKGHCPYGETRYNSGSTPTSYRFTGQREDATIGLHFYNARYYDAALGRFVQADSIVPNPINPQLFNRYSYAGNNPILYNDPDGHGAPLIVIVALAIAVWVSMEMPVGEEAPPHDQTAMYLNGVKTGLKLGGDTIGDGIALVDEYPENVGTNAFALVLPAFLDWAPKAAKGVLRYSDEVLEAGVPIGRSIGHWGKNSPSMSDAARAYQEFVTGATRGWEFNCNGVWFDGIRFAETGGEVLVDAKAIPGNFVDPISGSFQHWVSGTDDWLQQAANQVQAAGGVPIEWAFDNQAARDAMHNLFLEQNPDLLKSIDLVFRPTPSP